MMQNQSDAQLLRDYASKGSESAFGEIVARHTDLVYSAAWRQSGSPELAREIAQSVFTDLARKARALAGQFSPDASLAGWLYRGTRYAALKSLRSERRRREHERLVMQEQVNPASETSADWERVAPALDEAMAELGDADREAVLLRFFKNQDFRAVGLALGVSDDAAQKRVSRAVERLREFLAKRGVSIGTSGLVVIISTNSVLVAPAGLSAAITTAALAGTTVATSAIATATKAIAMTTLQKTVIGATLAVAVGTGIYETHQASTNRTQLQILQQQQAALAEQNAQLAREREDVVRQITAIQNENQRLSRDAAEVSRLRREVSLLRANPNTPARAAAPGSAPTGAGTSGAAADNAGAAFAESIANGRELGLAVVRGDAGAFEKMAELAKAERQSFATNRVGLDDNALADLSRQTFAPLHAAFDVIAQAGANGSQVAVDAVARAFQIPELKANAVKALGTLAGNGNDAALETLLHPEKYGFLLSSAVGALKPAAENGNPKAIEALAAIAGDTSLRPLWFMAADGLGKAAESGNPVAIDTLVSLSSSTNRSVHDAVVRGLRGAAANQNPKAAETLRAMGIQ